MFMKNNVVLAQHHALISSSDRTLKFGPSCMGILFTAQTRLHAIQPWKASYGIRMDLPPSTESGLDQDICGRYNSGTVIELSTFILSTFISVQVVQ